MSFESIIFIIVLINNKFAEYVFLSKQSLKYNDSLKSLL